MASMFYLFASQASPSLALPNPPRLKLLVLGKKGSAMGKIWENWRNKREDEERAKSLVSQSKWRTLSF